MRAPVRVEVAQAPSGPCNAYMVASYVCPCRRAQKVYGYLRAYVFDSDADVQGGMWGAVSDDIPEVAA